MEKRRTILAGLVSIVLLIGTPFMTAQAAPAVVSVSPPSVDVSQGQTFTVNITVDPKGNEICAAQYVLLYSDNNLLNATSQTQGPFLSQDGLETIVVANIINNTLGKVEYGEFRTGEGLEHGVTAPGALASITFEVIGTSGRSNLKLSDVILLDPNEEELETEINDGTVIIGKVTGEPAIADITVEKAHEMMEANPEEIILLDVRTEEEYEERHIPDAVNIPLSELESRIGELDKYKSKKIIVYCKTGSRSRTANKILVQHGPRTPLGCALGREKCTYFHPKMCSSSTKNGKCLNAECKLRHVNGTIRLNEEKVIPTKSHTATSGNDSNVFLDALHLMKQEILAEMDKRISVLMEAKKEPQRAEYPQRQPPQPFMWNHPIPPMMGWVPNMNTMYQMPRSHTGNQMYQQLVPNT